MLLEAFAIVSMVVQAAPPPPVAKVAKPEGERATVLLNEAIAPDAAALIAAYATLSSTAMSELKGANGGQIAVAIAQVGRVTVTLKTEAMAEAETAFRRGISSLITDTPLQPHIAQWLVEVMPDAGVTRVAALDTLARVCTALAGIGDHAVGVYFEAGRVVHPATYVRGAVREKIPAAWLWVGFELGGNTTLLTLTSAGLAKAGLMELELSARRQEIGAAIETFFELVTAALERGKDFADGEELARKEGPAYVVHVGVRPDGLRVWRVGYVAVP